MSSKVVLYVGVLYLLLAEDGLRRGAEELLDIVAMHFKGVVLQADLEHIAQTEGREKLKQISRKLRERGITIHRSPLQKPYRFFGESGIVYSATHQLPILFALGINQQLAEAYASEQRLLLNSWNKDRLKQEAASRNAPPTGGHPSPDAANISSLTLFINWISRWPKLGFSGILQPFTLFLIIWLRGSLTKSEIRKSSNFHNFYTGDGNGKGIRNGSDNDSSDNGGVKRTPYQRIGDSAGNVIQEEDTNSRSALNTEVGFTRTASWNQIQANVATYLEDLAGQPRALHQGSGASVILTWNGNELFRVGSSSIMPTHRGEKTNHLTADSASGTFSLLIQRLSPDSDSARIDSSNVSTTSQLTTSSLALISSVSGNVSSSPALDNNSENQNSATPPVSGTVPSSSTSDSNSESQNPANFFASKFNSGVFTVGVTGQVSIDYLFDGGAYQGELGIFSLHGLERYELGSQAFIQEVVRRVVSNSTSGHVAISDPAEGARFSGEFAWEPNFNAGEYLGIKTFSMQPDDQFGIVMIPNGTFQQVLNTPTLGEDRYPLFSFVTTSSNTALPSQQIADVTGHGQTFAMEDQAIDRGSDRDYNDIVFQIEGAIGSAVKLDQVINPTRDWRTLPAGQNLLAYIQSTEKQPSASSANPGLNAVSDASALPNLPPTSSSLGQDLIPNQARVDSGSTRTSDITLPSLPPVGSQVNRQGTTVLQQPLTISYNFNPS